MDNILTFARSFFGADASDGSSVTHVDRLSPDSDLTSTDSGRHASEIENAQTLINKLNKCVKALGDKDDQINSLHRQMRSLTENLVRQTADIRQLHREQEALEAQVKGTQTQLGTMEGLYQSEKSFRISAQSGHKQSSQYHNDRIRQLETLVDENNVRARVLENRCRELETYEKMVMTIRECEGGKSRRKRMRRESFHSEDSDGGVETVRSPIVAVTCRFVDQSVV